MDYTRKSLDVITSALNNRSLVVLWPNGAEETFVSFAALQDARAEIELVVAQSELVLIEAALESGRLNLRFPDGVEKRFSDVGDLYDLCRDTQRLISSLLCRHKSSIDCGAGRMRFAVYSPFMASIQPQAW